MGWDLWVDFNDLDGSGRLVAFADRARPGVELRRGAEITVGDGEGSVARAMIERRYRWRRSGELRLRVIMESFNSKAEVDGAAPSFETQDDSDSSTCQPDRPAKFTQRTLPQTAPRTT